MRKKRKAQGPDSSVNAPLFKKRYTTPADSKITSFLNNTTGSFQYEWMNILIFHFILVLEKKTTIHVDVLKYNLLYLVFICFSILVILV